MRDNRGSLQMPQICGQAASTADLPNEIRTEEHKLLFTAPQETQRTPRDLMSCAALRRLPERSSCCLYCFPEMCTSSSLPQCSATLSWQTASRGFGPNGTAPACLPSFKRAEMNESKHKSRPLIDYCPDKSRIDRQHSFMYSDLCVWKRREGEHQPSHLVSSHPSHHH